VWKAYNLHNVFPNRYMQDMQGFFKIEAYCFASTVYYLNSFTRYRLRRLQKQDHIDNINERVKDGSRTRYPGRNIPGQCIPARKNTRYPMDIVSWGLNIPEIDSDS
jgi:hypothetical protein